ncbi:MAG TPA: LamG-like jellyroll fold domain-containing protein [Methylomirabilota bacterium]|nr:LamG-like jellyroll fold domain-containing protein [Methylomirabilota bacterium]
MHRLIAALVFLFCATVRVFPHADKVEDRLVMHFATGGHPPSNGRWEDINHRHLAEVKGTPTLTNIGPAVALQFNGYTDHMLVPIKPEDLPVTAISLAAWVIVNETMADGGIISYAQDNGPQEKGFALGFDERSFTFSLATEKADDGDGKLTRIRANTPLTAGKWHYVVGTYDGETMKLFVNGREEATSKEQGGKILYPAKGRFTIGAYIDDNEFHAMDGALYEAKVYGRAMVATEIQAAARQNRALLDHESSINKELKFVVAPYLQFGTRDSMTIMCETSAEAQMLVEYAERQPLVSRTRSEEARLINTVTLSGLKPHTQYFYRVTCTDKNGNVARSDILTLQTAPGPETPWAFGIIGDTQRNPEVTKRATDGIFALRPNMTIHCGDVVDDGFAKHQWVSDLFAPSATLFSHVPLFPVIGNHEKNAHWYYDYFHLPKPEYYYTFTYGNAQFFMIDSNKDLSPGSEQYRWLEAELRKSKATWKFTCHHHPCFSSDENDYGDRWKGKAPEGFRSGDENAQRLVELYEKYRVDVAFAGHIHSYERAWPILQMQVNQKNGVRYIVSGGGGGGLEQAAPQRAWFTVHVQRGHHYCYAAVHDRTIQFKAYDLEGRLFDTFELTKGR